MHQILVQPKVSKVVRVINVVRALNLHTHVVGVVGVILHVHHLIESREKLLALRSAVVVLVNLQNGVVIRTKNLVVNSGMLQQTDGLSKETVVVVVAAMTTTTMMVVAMMMVGVVVHDRKYLSMQCAILWRNL